MITSVKTLVKVASSFDENSLKAVTENAVFNACTASDLLHYAVLQEIEKAFNDELSSVIASVDYVDSNRDTQSALFYAVSKDTASNTSKQLCKVYLKRDLSAHIVINASLKDSALKDERMKACFDEQHKKCVRFVASDLNELVKLLKVIRTLNK